MIESSEIYSTSDAGRFSGVNCCVKSGHINAPVTSKGFHSILKEKEEMLIMMSMYFLLLMV